MHSRKHSTLLGRYAIVKNGKKVHIDAIGRKNILEIKGSFEVEFFDANGVEVGTFRITNEGELFHRRVIDEYQGFGFGKLGFEIVERDAKKKGMDKLWLDLKHKSVLKTVLHAGFKIAPKSVTSLKKILSLPKKGKLPSAKVLIELIEKSKLREKIPL